MMKHSHVIDTLVFLSSKSRNREVNVEPLAGTENQAQLEDIPNACLKLSYKDQNLREFISRIQLLTLRVHESKILKL